MKEEALKLADELDLIAGMIAIGDRIKWGQDSKLMENGSVMIRRLVEELDKQSEPYGWVIKSQHQGMIYKDKPKGMATIPLYTTPQTKPLTNDEIRNIGDECELKNNGILNWIDFARAIEERHGIK